MAGNVLPSGGWIRVWDPFVRIGHWVLVITFFTCYLTEGEPEWLHDWSGYLLTAVVLLRIVWGFIGPRYARFSDFVRPPGEALRYFWDELRGRAPRHIGHSPSGGAMIVALLLALLVSAGSGMVVLAMEEGEGPLAGWLVTPLPGGEEEDSPQLETAEEVHEIAANVTLILVILHIAGVLLGSWRNRENLVGAMITGRKWIETAPDRPDQKPPTQR
jgi:cytochrome b